MVATPPLTVRVTRRFEAAPERVFDAWLEPETVRAWLTAVQGKATPGELVRVEIDARVGGAFTFIYRNGGEEVSQAGVYLEIDRPRRLAFTWRMPSFDADFGRVVVEIAPREKGCELTLTHEMDPAWADHAEGAESGWTLVLGAMAETVVNG